MKMLDSPRNELAFNGRDVILLNFLLGGAAAAISKSTVAPIERVKLLLQVQDVHAFIDPSKRYSGFIDCLVRIPREQGFRSFWRGNTINVIRVFPKNAINFASKDKYKDLLKKYLFGETNVDKNVWSHLSVNLLSGSAAGVTGLCILHPLDFARTRLAADTGRSLAERQFTGLGNCLTKTFKSDGIRGLYRGFLISIPEIMIFRGAYFGFYDTAKDVFVNPSNSSLLLTYIIAQVVTTASGLVAYPFDTVRRRMMMQSCLAPDKRVYPNTRSCLRKMYYEEGFSSFYKGGMTNVLRGVGGALVLVLFDQFKDNIMR